MHFDMGKFYGNGTDAAFSGFIKYVSRKNKEATEQRKQTQTSPHRACLKPLNNPGGPVFFCLS